MIDNAKESFVTNSRVPSQGIFLISDLAAEVRFKWLTEVRLME
jgi:hypothetical protein